MNLTHKAMSENCSSVSSLPLSCGQSQQALPPARGNTRGFHLHLFSYTLTARSLVSALRPVSAFLFFLLVSGICSPASVFSKQAILTSFKGTVEIQAKGSTLWRKANPKMLIQDGEKIRTLKGAKATLIFEDGSRTELSPETQLVMSQLIIPVSLEQLNGKTRNRVAKNGKGFALRTPTAVCSVRGTDFSVGVAEGGQTQLDVFEGTVNGLKTATGESLDVGAGQSLTFTGDSDPLGAPTPTEGAEQESSLKDQAKKEVALDMTREQLQAAAAEEMKSAEYIEGKTLIDVNGLRVRLEEYITRKNGAGALLDDGKGFKFVVLNWRESRSDYFTYKGVFNKLLPADLSIALRNVSGRVIGDQPEYYLTKYEMSQSNLQDAIKDMADGGHLVEVTFDGTAYNLKAHDVAADGTAGTVTDTAVQNASAGGKTYDPVSDLYKNNGTSLDAAYDPVTDSFKQMKAGETLWRTVYNRYGHLLGSAKDLSALTLDNVPAGTLTQPWYQYYSKAAGITNIATLEQVNNAGVTTDGVFISRGKTLDLVNDQQIGNANFKYLNGHYAFDSYFPDAPKPDAPTFDDAIHQRLITFYPKSATDIPFEQYDTYIISNEGKVPPISAFSNATSGKAFKEELIKWNYEQITRSSSFGGRTIDLVVEPKILIRSGLIK